MMAKWMRCRRAALVVAVLLAIAGGGEARAELMPEAKAERTLRKVDRHYRELDGLRCKVTFIFNMQTSGMKQELESVYTVALQRPNKLAMILQSGMLGPTIVSDGTQLTTCMQMLKQYTKSPAPASLPEVLQSGGDVLGGSGLSALLLDALTADEPYTTLMEGVTNVTFLGADTLGEVKCVRLGFEQEEFDWELWVQDGKRPWILQVRADLSKSMREAAAEASGMEFREMVMTLRYTDWDANPELADADFVFQPPEGVQEVKSFGRDSGRETLHALVGKPAPGFALEGLDGETVALGAHHNKAVVILDFWATWCGPCRKGLPILREVAEAYRERDVVFYAVNQKEEPDAIREFLTKAKLEVPVLLDPDGKVGDDYGVSAIPQTVIIGKDGTVQVVHVGITSGWKAQLRSELDAILAGKDLAGEALRQAQATVEAVEPEGLEAVWSMAGAYVAVAAEPAGGRVVAVTAQGKGIEVDAVGEQVRDFTLGGRLGAVRTATLAGDATALLGFTAWGRSVDAYDAEGAVLWSYAVGQGVDDVWAHDVTGDGMDEVIIGYNGNTGLHVLDNRGDVLWTYTQIANVWHVCAGDLDGDGTPEVISTSAQGKVHVFSAEGELRQTHDAGCYANMVRVGWLADKAPVVLVAGQQDSRTQVVALDGQGVPRWSVPLPAGGKSVLAARAAATAPWLAVAMRDGAVYVLDLAEGAMVGRMAFASRRLDVAWLDTGDGAPLLVVATGQSLRAFRVTGTPAVE